MVPTGNLQVASLGPCAGAGFLSLSDDHLCTQQTNINININKNPTHPEPMNG